MKFIRRAVEDDKNLQVVILLRTAENKYWRGDVSDPDELIGGFPKTREELFAYRAIILGSVEAASFTPEQLRMLADFVSKRGGGLLMLGGRRSFAEGGWGGTPVGEVLPVVIESGERGNVSRRASSVAADARRRHLPGHAARRRRRRASNAKWNDMPPVSTVNSVREVEAGRDGAADRRRQPQAGTDRPRLSALRARQGDRAADPGLVAVADGREDGGRPTRRTRCSGGGWSAGWSTACRSRST